METAHASTDRAPTTRELNAKIDAVIDFHDTQQMELTGHHLQRLEQRARMLWRLHDDQCYIERMRELAREVADCKCCDHAA